MQLNNGLDAMLGRTTKEKELGVTFSAEMKVSEQCGFAASKGSQIIGLIKGTLTCKETLLIIPLCNAIICPHYIYYIHTWMSYRKKDIYKLERIQRRATKIISELRDLSYECRSITECKLYWMKFQGETSTF